MKKFNKVLALCLALVLVVGCFAACGNGGSENKATGMSESPIAEVELKVDYEVPADFKIGFICLHDEDSTYDLNFLNAVDKIQEVAGCSEFRTDNAYRHNKEYQRKQGVQCGNNESCNCKHNVSSKIKSVKFE